MGLPMLFSGPRAPKGFYRQSQKVGLPMFLTVPWYKMHQTVFLGLCAHSEDRENTKNDQFSN